MKVFKLKTLFWLIMLLPLGYALRLPKQDAAAILNKLIAPFTTSLEVDSFGLIPIKGGTFTMGCTSEQGSDCKDDEKPSHRVTVSDFKLGKFEVTQAQWRKIMGRNTSTFSGCDQCPVIDINWEDIRVFLRVLNLQTGKNYRLPTEIEWEYAARGGNKSAGYKYAGSNIIEVVAWYIGNSNLKPHPVGGKKANELGLHDMSGNVLEFCQDWKGAYSSRNQTISTLDAIRGLQVIRGGSWFSLESDCRVSDRSLDYRPALRMTNLGFRLAL